MTDRNPGLQCREDVEARAADFLQRRYLMRWSVADQAELDAWLDEDTLHRVTFLRLEAGAARIEKLSDLHPSGLARMIERWRMRFFAPFLASAASLALIGVLGFAAEQYLRPAPDRSFSTDIGGRAMLNFPDGTQMALNTDTALRFRMTGEERTVWLERGEAWFRVAHDAARPFAVIVGNHRVTDLGTEFLVRRDTDGVEVALMKGRASLSAEGAQSATLTPGDDVVATPVSMSVTRKTAQQLADALAWQRGVLVFRQTKLSDAVNEINRYSRTKLVIGDRAVADMTIGGEFRTDSIDGFLEAMQSVLKLRVGRDGNNILISRETKKPERYAP